MSTRQRPQSGATVERDLAGRRLAVVILTLNEARRIARCIGAVPVGIPVYVLDSGSMDETCDIAEAAGAKVLCNPWPGFAGQRNHALDRLADVEWVLFVDADEAFPPALFDWVADFIAPDPPIDVVQIPSKLRLDGTILRHAPGYPIYHPRLARTGRAYFVNNGTGHGETVAQGLRIAHAPVGYVHDFLDDGYANWAAKHVRLARLEVAAAGAAAKASGVASFRRRLARLAPKGLSRVVLRFCFHYLVCRGFLDGRAGFRYSLIYAWYEATKWLVSRDPPDPHAEG
jgi:glycosyltransferase involved in cell wall biosynthesis